MKSPRTFNTLTKDAEFHLGHAARVLQEAAKEAPTTGLERFAARQAGNLTQLRRILPAVRARAKAAQP